ncbi:MAG: flavin reductase family protein [Opitutaceae bacterium]|jgi:flavin reductase (DIM6/NTAB) family NADH-FMN oxidoreductase RutF|nr:flavin reductase family protein [Opitutaceae bacterium]
MLINLASLKSRDAYHWMTSAIIPRPIAWVSTVSANGKTNLAPFSFFQGVTSVPPSLLFVAVNTRDGSKKDTVRNVEATGEFVVNLVPEALAAQTNATGTLLPYGESEFEKFNIAPAPSARVAPPRVAAAPVAFECKRHSIVPVGEGPGAASIVIGVIESMYVDDAVLGADGWPDAAKLGLVGRMGGEVFVRTKDTFTLPRPPR